MNKEDEELVRMVNPTLKRRETILFFLIVVINGLKCIVSDIGLDTCARGRWRVEVCRASVQKLCCVIPFFILIIFRSIIQFLVVLFPLLLWLNQHYMNYPCVNLEHNIFLSLSFCWEVDFLLCEVDIEKSFHLFIFFHGEAINLIILLYFVGLNISPCFVFKKVLTL